MRGRIIAGLTALAVTVALTACTDAPDAERVLEANGFVDVRAGGYDFTTCSEDDTFATRFEARTRDGQQVSGAVCRGWLKGSTVRLD